MTNVSDFDNGGTSELEEITGCQPGDFFNVLGLLLQAILAALAFSLLMSKINLR